MDLKIDLKNIKFEDIKEKIKSTDKKTFIKIGIAVGSVILFLIIYYAILNPIVERKKAKLKAEHEKQLAINMEALHNGTYKPRPWKGLQIGNE